MPPNRPDSVRQAGMTIAELLVVVAVIGLLTAIVIWHGDTAFGGLNPDYA